MKLYLLTTQKLGDFYVVASDPTRAETMLILMLNKADYGFSDDRKVVNIKNLATEIHNFPDDKPFFSDKSNLIIINP